MKTLFLAAFLLTTPMLIAQETSETHDELRKLRTDLEAVVATSQWEQLKPFLSQRVIVTWIDGTQSHGPEEVVEYLQSKTGGEDPIVDKFGLKVDAKELSDLYGDDTALAFGTATSNFVLRERELSVTGPWSATMIREDQTWKLASLSASVGAFDNPLLTWTWRFVWIGAAISAVVSVLFGLLIGRLISRKSRTAVDGGDVY